MKQSSALLVFVCILMAGCGGSHKGTTDPNPGSPPPEGVNVTVSPSTATVASGSVFSAFVATVTGATNTAVTWMVDGITGGNTAVGSIDASGHYTAPAQAGNHTVTAQSVADPTKIGNAQVTVTQTFSITISPSSATVLAKETQQFTASISPTPNLGVVWSIDGVAGGNATIGTIDVNGLYTAPSRSGTHSITATSKDNQQDSATAQVTIPPASTLSTRMD